MCEIVTQAATNDQHCQQQNEPMCESSDIEGARCFQPTLLRCCRCYVATVPSLVSCSIAAACHNCLSSTARLQLPLTALHCHPSAQHTSPLLDKHTSQQWTHYYVTSSPTSATYSTKSPTSPPTHSPHSTNHCSSTHHRISPQHSTSSHKHNNAPQTTCNVPITTIGRPVMRWVCHRMVRCLQWRRRYVRGLSCICCWHD